MGEGREGEKERERETDRENRVEDDQREITGQTKFDGRV